MDLTFGDLGVFPATEDEVEEIAHYRSLHPEFTAEELLCAVYLNRCVVRARLSPVRGGIHGDHVTAADLLAVSPGVAEEVFGPDAPQWLAAIGIRGSRDFGEIVWRFIRIGFFGSLPEDHPEQFHTDSDLDEYLHQA